ncbi:MAG: PspA/IM30 family protein [Proteobacteria bacterium]|nr:PspA/IM30 family protein [Pseudomonadota bacterium]
MADFFNRLTRVFKGKANQGVSALEDATFETTLKQTVRDMEQELNKVIRSSADAMSNYNRLESEHEKWIRQSDDWKSKAKKALSASNEDLAKKALAKKSECDEQVASLKPSVEDAARVRDQLKNQVAELRKRIAEARRNASTLIARKNAANAQKKVAQVLSGVHESDNAFSVLNEFQEKVEREEAMARAYEGMSAEGEDESLKKEFAALDVSDTDSELAELKAEMEKDKK